MLCRDGSRFLNTARDHTRIEIVAIPGARKRAYSYVKLDPKPMGNGRPDRGIHRCNLSALARHYTLVAAGSSRYGRTAAPC